MQRWLSIISIACIVMFIISSIGLAQDAQQPPQGPDGPGGPGDGPNGPGGPGGPGSEEYLTLLIERLQLTDAQVEDVRALFEEQNVQMQAIFEKYKDTQDQASREAMMAETQEVRNAVDAILRELLTAEQLTAYQAFQEEQRQQMEERRNEMEERRQQGQQPQNQL